LTGRERIEAAFSAEGTRDLPAVICYESVFLRDHWPQLTQHPWWTLHVSDAQRRVAAGRRNGSRFILSLGSPVTPETPIERVRL